MKKPLYLVEKRNKITVHSDGPSLLVTSRNKAPMRIPVRTIDKVVIIGNVRIDANSIILCAENKIPVLFIDSDKTEKALVLPYNHKLPNHYKEQRLILQSKETIMRYKKWILTRRNMMQVQILKELFKGFSLPNEIGEGNYQFLINKFSQKHQIKNSEQKGKSTSFTNHSYQHYCYSDSLPLNSTSLNSASLSRHSVSLSHHSVSSSCPSVSPSGHSVSSSSPSVSLSGHSDSLSGHSVSFSGHSERSEESQSNWIMVKDIIENFLRAIITGRIIKAGLDIHLGIIHRRVNYGLLLDLSMIFEPEADFQTIKFFQSSKLEIENGELTEIGIKQIIDRFESRKEKFTKNVETVIDELFEIIKDIRK